MPCPTTIDCEDWQLSTLGKSIVLPLPFRSAPKDHMQQMGLSSDEVFVTSPEEFALHRGLGFCQFTMQSDCLFFCDLENILEPEGPKAERVCEAFSIQRLRGERPNDDRTPPEVLRSEVQLPNLHKTRTHCNFNLIKKWQLC